MTTLTRASISAYGGEPSTVEPARRQHTGDAAGKPMPPQNEGRSERPCLSNSDRVNSYSQQIPIRIEEGLSICDSRRSCHFVNGLAVTRRLPRVRVLLRQEPLSA